MIKTENLTLAKRGDVDLGQRVEVKCDKCGLDFTSTLRNYLANKASYSADLCRSCKQRAQYSNGSREQQRNALINRNKSLEGKTSEEIRGIEKTRLMKMRMSAKSSGENNPNFGGKYSKCEAASSWSKARKGWSVEEKFGIERGAEIRKKISNRTSGQNNPMYGKPSPLGSGNGWCGWLSDFFFRSLLELSYLKSCIDAGIKVESAESSIYQVKYCANGIERTYFPDYYLPDTDEIVEVKPSNLVKARTNLLKFEAARIKYGKNFKIITEKEVKRLSNQDLAALRKLGVIKFINRYEQKFKEKYEDKILSL